MRKNVITALIALATFSVFAPSLASARMDATPATATATARREFLSRLGFNDVPAEIRARLGRNEWHSELNRRQMEANAVAYEVLNSSRELSVFILEEVPALQVDSAKARALSAFGAKMLALKPLAPPTTYPSQLMALPAGEAREAALIEWLHAQRVVAMNEHKARLLSDTVGLLYARAIKDKSAQIRKIDRLLTTIVDRMYNDDTIGNGKYLGRALAALLIREEVLQGQANEKPLTKQIANELKTEFALRLENFIGDTIVIPGEHGEKSYKVENGTMMLSRNLAPGSLQISWAAIPERISDRWRARAQGLIGNPLATPLYVTPEDTADGIDLKMRIRDRIAQGGIIREGFSHIVYYEVKEDPETGIKMARVIDNYPARVFDATNEYIRTGGTRLTYPEQVIDMSHHSAVYFANPQAEKVQEWSRLSHTQSGYQAEFFPSIELDLKDGLYPTKNTRVENWKTTITRENYERLHSETDARKLSKEIWSRYAAGLEETVYEGWTFHWPDPYDFYLVGSTYCSQLGDMVMRKFVGMPLQQTKSVWHWAVRFFANIGRLGEELKKSSKFSAIGEKLLNLPNVRSSMKVAKIEIIAPNSLVLQPFMKGEFFRLASRSPEQRVQSSFLADGYREKDPVLTRQIEQTIPLYQFDDRKRDVMLDVGAAMRDLEYGIVMRASQGLKTHDFSPEKMAELAVTRVKTKVTGAYSSRRCSDLFR